MIKNLNEIQDMMTIEGVITDEILESFNDIDGMGSTTSIAWMIKVCRITLNNLKNGKQVFYKDELLTENSLKKLYNENLSEYVLKKIYE